MADDLAVFVDIDGTLTDDPHQAWGAPVQHRIDQIRLMIERGESVVVWSARGKAYALDFAAAHGLQGALCIGKPAKCVDDNPTIRRREGMPVLSPREFFGE